MKFKFLMLFLDVLHVFKKYNDDVEYYDISLDEEREIVRFEVKFYE